MLIVKIDCTVSKVAVSLSVVGDLLLCGSAFQVKYTHAPRKYGIVWRQCCFSPATIPLGGPCSSGKHTLPHPLIQIDNHELVRVRIKHLISWSRYNNHHTAHASFKKTINRTGTTVSYTSCFSYEHRLRYFLIQLMQKTGQIERTVDTAFKDEEVKFKTYVSRVSPRCPSPT